MKSFFQLRSNNLIGFQLSRSQLLCYSTAQSKSLAVESLHNKNTKETRNERQPNDLSTLFGEISQLLGVETLDFCKNEPGFPIFKAETQVKNKEESCTPGVCENANDSVLDESIMMSVDTPTGNLTETEITSLVQKVTDIVRSDNNGAGSLEERLDKESLDLDRDVVDRVLKRCSRVPQLAFRFFNWVKLRKEFNHTTQTYNTMMNIAGASKEFELLEQLAEEMRENSCEMDIRTYTILISHYGNVKMIGKALMTYENMRLYGLQPDPVVYKLMLRALCNAGKADIAMEFYKEMTHKDMEPDIGLFKLLLKCLARAGERNDIDLVVSDMTRVTQVPYSNACTIVLRSFCISGRIREALEYIGELKNREVALDAEIFEILLQGLFKADRVTDALEVVDIMKRKNAISKKIYGIIIHAYLRRNETDKALEIFQNMKNSGLLPSVTTYTNLMQHLFRLNEFQKASELYDEMIEKGLELDCIAIMSMVAGLVQQRHICEAWNVFKSMEKKGIMPTPKFYSIYIKELRKVSMTDEIIKVLKEMKTKTVCLDINTYKRILTYLEGKGEMDKVQEVKQMQITSTFFLQEGEEYSMDLSNRLQSIEEMDSTQIDEKSLASRVGQSPPSCSDDNLQEVCRILSSSKDWISKEGDLKICTIQFTTKLVVDILRNCSLHSGAALRFFSWVGKQAGYSHTTETYNMAIKISGRAKDFNHMRTLANEMRSEGCLVTQDTWTIMIMQYGRIGLTDIALKYFKEMKASHINPTGSTYKYLIISLCGTKGRIVHEAIHVFKEMLKAGHVPDKELVETYLNCLCVSGKLQDARKCVDSLCKVGFTVPLAYSFYIRALSRAGRLEEALTIVDEVGREHHALYHYTYGSLVHGMLRKGQLEEALSKIESMKQVGIHPTIHVYTSLIVYYFREKEIAKALQMLSQMKEEGCEPSAVTYSVLIRGYMTMGKIHDAWTVFRQMKLEGPQPDFHTYSMFITCLCKVSKSEEALQLLSQMVDDGIVPSTVNFRTVNFGLNREGKQDLARTVLQMKSNVTTKRKFLT